MESRESSLGFILNADISLLFFFRDEGQIFEIIYQFYQKLEFSDQIIQIVFLSKKLTSIP